VRVAKRNKRYIYSGFDLQMNHSSVLWRVCLNDHSLCAFVSSVMRKPKEEQSEVL